MIPEIVDQLSSELMLEKNFFSTSFPAFSLCKCCGSSAMLSGFVDFAKDVYGFNFGNSLVSGIPLPYYRCKKCRFGFTDAFDHWSPEEFKRNIYNSNYHLYDPRYKVDRPHKTSSIVQQAFPGRDISILDYGSGNGLTTELLRKAGYRSVIPYDPYSEPACEKPIGKFDLIVCVEVIEHSVDPIGLAEVLAGFCAKGASILISTKDFSDLGDEWVHDPYVAPRNGHVSFFSRETFEILARIFDGAYFRMDRYRHLFVMR